MYYKKSTGIILLRNAMISFVSRKLGNLAEVLPGILIGGDIYKNRDKRLPDAPGRVWYEADFNYEGGYRNHCRLLYSNDGLVFVTCDHYLTFQEIVLEVIE